jgi:hypothetical protein
VLSVRTGHHFRRTVAGLLVAVLAAVLAAGCTQQSEQSPVLSVRAREFYAPAWLAAVGGDVVDGAVLDFAVLNTLDNLGFEAAAVRDAVTAVWLADVTGSKREAFGSYFTNVQPGACSSASVIGVSPFSMGSVGGVEYVKALVAWSGTCAVMPLANSVQVASVYMMRTDNAWQPVREGAIPQSPEQAAASAVPAWALGDLACSRGEVARWELVAAWGRMCQDAAAAGVTLQVESGWRSATAQADRFAGAVEFYGSREDAEKYVAFSDQAACASRHCAGEAIDVAMDATASAWLRAVVGCQRVDGGVVLGAACRADERAVLKMEQYGFVEPLASSPGHLEYALGVSAIEADGCEDSLGGATAALVVSLFRCVVRELGDVSDEVLREALAVAQCESGMNPAGRQLQGAYRTNAHLVSGRVYEGLGLFGLTDRRVGELVAGGRAKDAWSNTLAAARLYVQERQSGRDGWGPFVCARGDAAIAAVLGTSAPWPAWIELHVTPKSTPSAAPPAP